MPEFCCGNQAHEARTQDIQKTMQGKEGDFRPAD